MKGQSETTAAGPQPFSPPWSMGILLLLLLAALSATSNYLAFVPWEGATGAMRIHWPWWRTFLVTTGQWLALLPFILAIARIVANAPLGRGHWSRSLSRHALAILVLAPLYFLATRGLYFLVNATVSSWAEAREILAKFPLRVLLSNLFAFPVVYGALAVLCYAWTFRRREREKEHRAALLERQLAQAQLQMLRMQLNPHFLFNTLNAIVTLVHRDPDTAERMIIALTDFLRNTLEEGTELETPLARELETVERYLAIECLRFPGRIALEQDLHPGTLHLPVPSLLLQPLVENAVRHGLAPRPDGGRIWIQARLAEGSLHLSVEDDGVGPQAPRAGRTGGVGLANARERIAQRYGSGGRFEAAARPGGGFRVAMALPLASGEAAE